MDAQDPIEAIAEATVNAGVDRSDDLALVPGAQAGLPAGAPAVVLRERWGGREWIVGVTARQRGIRWPGGAAPPRRPVAPPRLRPRWPPLDAATRASSPPHPSRRQRRPGQPRAGAPLHAASQHDETS